MNKFDLYLLNICLNTFKELESYEKICRVKILEVEFEQIQ